MKKPTPPKGPSSPIPPAEATPITRIGEDSITRVNSHSMPTKMLVVPLEENLRKSNIDRLIEGENEFYDILGTIEDNDRGIVFYAQGLETAKEVVIKKFFEAELFEREKNIQNILKSQGDYKHILLADEFLDDQSVAITAYMKGGDLRQLERKLQKAKIFLDPYQAQSFVSGACKALQYLHGCKIVHRDIKSKNMALDITIPDSTIIAPEKLLSAGTTLKLFDYELGWHNDFAHYHVPGQIVGTPYYTAPEVILGASPDPRSDIYSLGVVLYQLFTGSYPFNGDQTNSMQQH